MILLDLGQNQGQIPVVGILAHFNESDNSNDHY